ncbi:uncharacterized protein LOC34623353 [Cyclospora cayetanensis]|uniref:Uncharacterized protein LOC34623353 n=1 Tax=Cyclospora cayetanensis TaxID=88456 RepID=A0A6P6RYQ5_9EIME|nr:uncharacterized protein LOC34623353 [Cyclospora cayetanensis]
MEDEGSSLDGSQPLLAVAPMIAVSNSHFRNFMRLLTRKTTLYTEMVVDSTILHNTHHLDDHIGFDEYEHPVVCQLGGSNADTVSEAATWVERTGYDEVNLNVGCPSCRVVSKGCFGAALMRTPEKVRDIVYQMKRRVQIPVTVKCRLGVDTLDSPEFTRNFVEGVDPKKNRSVPPLLYDRVFALHDAFPNLRFSINGGVTSLEQAHELLSGKWRELNANGAKSDTTSFLEHKEINGGPGLHGAYLDYLERYEQSARKPKSPFVLLKPVLGVLCGMPGQRHFRNTLDTKIRCSTPNEPAVEALLQAMDAVDNEFPGVLDYPINLGKNPHYSEITSVAEMSSLLRSASTSVTQRAVFTVLSCKDFSRGPLGICHCLLAIYAAGGGIGASLASSVGPRGTLIVASSIQLCGCFLAFSLDEFNELFHASNEQQEFTVPSVKNEIQRFGSIASRCASSCLVMVFGLLPILMARYAFTPVAVSLYRLTPAQSNVLVTAIGASMIGMQYVVLSACAAFHPFLRSRRRVRRAHYALSGMTRKNPCPFQASMLSQPAAG